MRPSSTHCDVSPVDWHTVRAAIEEDGPDDKGRGDGGVVGGWRRGAVLIAVCVCVCVWVGVIN